MSIQKGMNLSVISLSGPIFIEVFLQMLIGNVDQFMMSHYSDNAVVAVANANQVMNIFIMLLTVMSTATTILIAHYLGARDRSKIAEVCTVSLFFNAVFSTVAGLIIILGQEYIFRWLDVPPQVQADTSLYATIVSCALPIQGLYFAMVATFRGHSWTKIPMYVSLVMNIVHIISNAILIFGWGPIPSLGVLGVSISTNLSKCLGLCLLIYIFKTRLQVPVAWQYLRPFPWGTLRQLLHISVPSGGETLSYQLSQTVILKMINIFGVMVVTTKVYVSLLAMLCYMYTLALSSAGQIIVGYLIGARRDNEVKGRVWRIMWGAMGISLVITTGMYLGSSYVLGIFTSDPEILTLGHTILLIEVFLEIGRTVNIVMVCCLQAAGDIRTPMIVGVFGMWVFAVNLSYLFGIVWGWGLIGIWWAMAIDEAIRALIFVYRWQSEKWKNRRLIVPT